MAVEKPREIAFRLLQQREEGREYIENLLEASMARLALGSADRGLVQEVAYGVVRWQATLDWLIDRKTSGKMQKRGLRNILRIGLYQLFWLSRIPDHAAVNESVELAKRAGFGAQAGFINAVLRGYLRDRDGTERLISDLRRTDLALGFSHPNWLCERWEKRIGRHDLVRLLEWNNTPPLAIARINALRIDAAHLQKEWVNEKVEARPIQLPWAPDALVYELISFPPLPTLPSFLKGHFYVQDPSTLLAVRELNARPGEAILDYCAAPGGKTAYIAEGMRNQGIIVAHDIALERIERIRENCLRLGVDCVETTLPSSLDKQRTTAFDRILVDAPCSNTGVMRRRVDLRWRIREEEISRLRKTQLQLLHDAVQRLKPDGTIVYSTCSLEPEENRGVVQEFLTQQPGMFLQGEKALTPWEHGVDGAYVARLTRGA